MDGAKVSIESTEIDRLNLATVLSALWPINSAVSEADSNLRAQLVVTGEVLRGLVSERARRLAADMLLRAGDFALKRAIAACVPTPWRRWQSTTVSASTSSFCESRTSKPGVDGQRWSPPGS